MVHSSLLSLTISVVGETLLAFQRAYLSFPQAENYELHIGSRLR